MNIFTFFRPPLVQPPSQPHHHMVTILNFCIGDSLAISRQSTYWQINILRYVDSRYIDCLLLYPTKICTHSLPPRSPMRILQYVGQVWHAVVSWSDFPLQGMSQTRTECNRTGQASCCVFTYKGRLKIRKQPAKKDYPEYLSHLFLWSFLHNYCDYTQKKVLYSYAQRSFYVIFFKIYF